MSSELTDDDLAWCQRVTDQYGSDPEKIVPRLFRAYESLVQQVETLTRRQDIDATTIAQQQTRLADERAAREQAESERERIHKLWQEDEAKGIERESKLERERGAALARVKELEGERNLLESQKSALARRVLELEDIKPLLDAEKLEAAETALASAREIVAQWGDHGATWCMSELRSLLTSHPAPVAAPLRPGEAGYRESLVPVAAPCAGCAELNLELEKQHAKLVELGDKLRIERTCAKVNSELIAAQKVRISALEQAITAAAAELPQALAQCRNPLIAGRIERALAALRAARGGGGA